MAAKQRQGQERRMVGSLLVSPPAPLCRHGSSVLKVADRTGLTREDAENIVFSVLLASAHIYLGLQCDFAMPRDQHAVRVCHAALANSVGQHGL